MKFVSIGSNCIDLYHLKDKDLPLVGGGPINICIYLNDYNIESSYVGAIALDEYGKLIYDQLNKRNIDLSHIRFIEGNSAISHVEIVNNERIFGEYEEGILKDYRLNKEDIEFINKHDILFCDFWSHQEEFLKELKNNIKIVYDFADKNPSDFDYISDINYLFYSRDEINNEEMKKIYAKGPEIVICMLGSKGSIAYDGNKFYECGIIENNNIIDTMGAGDSYIAGFIYGLLNNKDIEESMYLGSIKASETLSIFGAFKQ